MLQIIDLRSDTVTRPTEAMRAAMAGAEVGDDVFGDDPTVHRLEAHVAALLGKEAALFVPSGTMANLIAFLAQTRAGDTVILSEESHPFNYEGANLARFGGLLARSISSLDGRFGVADVDRVLVQMDDPHFSPTTLVAIENTVNRGSGACYTLEEVEAMGKYCREKGLRLHCDGARLFNAATALQVSPAALAAPCDSVSVCLSKGLGAPVGSVLASDGKTIHEARRCRKQLGGGLRQAGILAAAGLHALEHHMGDLREDHRRAAAFRRALEAVGVRFALPSPTNILFLETPDPAGVAAALRERGVWMVPFSQDRIRAVFHRDVDDAQTEAAIHHCAAVFSDC